MQFLVRKFEIITLGLGITAIFAMAVASCFRIEYYYFSYHFIAVHLRFSAKMATSNKSAKQFSVCVRRAERKCACVCATFIELSRNNACWFATQTNSCAQFVWWWHITHKYTFSSHMYHHLLELIELIERALCVCAVFFEGISRLFSWEFHMNCCTLFSNEHTQKKIIKKHTHSHAYELQNTPYTAMILCNARERRRERESKERHTIVKLNIHFFASILSGFTRLRS